MRECGVRRRRRRRRRRRLRHKLRRRPPPPATTLRVTAKRAVRRARKPAGRTTHGYAGVASSDTCNLARAATSRNNRGGRGVTSLSPWESGEIVTVRVVAVARHRRHGSARDRSRSIVATRSIEIDRSPRTRFSRSIEIDHRRPRATAASSTGAPRGCRARGRARARARARTPPPSQRLHLSGSGTRSLHATSSLISRCELERLPRRDPHARDPRRPTARS